MNNIIDINKAKKIIDKIDKKEKISYKDALTLLSSFEYDNNLNKKKLDKKEKKEITSPYTNVKSGNKAIKMIIISAIVVVVLTVIGYFIASGISGNDFQDTNVTYQIRR